MKFQHESMKIFNYTFAIVTEAQKTLKRHFIKTVTKTRLSTQYSGQVNYGSYNSTCVSEHFNFK